MTTDRPIVTKLDAFADLIANHGLTPTEAAIRLGKAPAYGNSMLQRLRAELGSKAR